MAFEFLVQEEPTLPPPGPGQRPKRKPRAPGWEDVEPAPALSAEQATPPANLPPATKREDYLAGVEESKPLGEGEKKLQKLGIPSVDWSSNESRLKFQKKRAEARDFALARAEKAAQIIFDDPDEQARLRQHLRHSEPEQYANVLHDWIGAGLPAREGLGVEAPSWDPGPLVREVEDAVSAYKRIAAEPEGAAIEAELKASDVAKLQEGISRLKEEELAKRREIPFAGSRLRQEELGREAENIAAARKEREAKITAIRGTQPAAAPPRSDLESNLRAAGAEPEDAWLDAKKELRERGIDIDDSRPVAFGPAVTSLWSALDQDGFQSFSRSLERRFPVEKKGAPPEERALPTPEEASRRERDEISRLGRELNEAGELQSWHSALAFVLLALAIGPRLAFVFFANSRRKGELALQIRDLERRAKLKEESASEEIKEAKLMRRFTAQERVRHELARERSGEADARRLRAQWLMLQLRGEEVRARLREKGALEDPTMKKLEKWFHLYRAEAAMHAQSLDYERAREANGRAEAILKGMVKREQMLEAAGRR